MRDPQRSQPHVAVEVALLLIILAAFARTAVSIGVGLDPHHDYFAVSPGLYALDGLRPHLDFYTHYGVFDAGLKSLLLRLGGGSLVGLRILAWTLDIGSLVLIGTLCGLDRGARCWLLALIGAWAIAEPAATGLRGTLYWHFLAWSSDLAIPLIAALTVLTTWTYRLALAALRDRTLRGARWLTALSAARGLLLVGLVAIKFTIGLSMLAMVVLADLTFWLLCAPGDEAPPAAAAARAPLARPLAACLGGGIVGVSAGALICWRLFGGAAGLPPLLQQVFTGQYEYFSSGSSFLLLSKVVEIVFSQDAFLACLLVVSLLASTSRGSRIALLALTLWLVIFRFGDYGQSLLRGDAARPLHVTALAYLIAALVVLPSLHWVARRCRRLRGATNLRQGLSAMRRRDPSPQTLYGLAVFPIAFASLTQFYPINDPMHTWWAVATALPAAACVLQGWFARHWQGSPGRILWLPILLNAYALVWTTGLLSADLRRHRLYAVASPAARPQLLQGLRSVDGQLARTAAALRALSVDHPRLILLEAGSPSLFELYSSPPADRARARCRIQPLSSLPVKEYDGLLTCLQQLRREGWEVIVTHNSPINPNPRLDGPGWQAWWAVVRQGPVPPLVRFARYHGSGRFSDGTIGGMRYWQLQG